MAAPVMAVGSSSWTAFGDKVTVDGTTITLNADLETSQSLVIPDGWTLEGNEHTIKAIAVAGTFDGKDPILTNDGSSGAVVTIKDVTIDADKYCAQGPCYGVVVKQADAVVQGVDILRVRQSADASSTKLGTALYIDNSQGTKKVTAEISGLMVDDYQKAGIVVDGGAKGVAAQITANEIGSNGGNTAITAYNLILKDNVSGEVSGNTITGNNSGDNKSVAVLLYGAGDVNVTANTIRNAQIGVAVTDSADAATGTIGIGTNMITGSSTPYAGIIIAGTGTLSDMPSSGVASGSVTARLNTIASFNTQCGAKDCSIADLGATAVKIKVDNEPDPATETGAHWTAPALTVTWKTSTASEDGDPYYLVRILDSKGKQVAAIPDQFVTSAPAAFALVTSDGSFDESLIGDYVATVFPVSPTMWERTNQGLYAYKLNAAGESAYADYLADVDLTKNGDSWAKVSVTEPPVVYEPEVATTPSMVGLGGTFTVSGTGFAAGEKVTIDIVASDKSVAYTLDATADDATWTSKVTLPATVEAGEYTVKVTGDVSEVPATAALTVSEEYGAAITADPETVNAGADLTIDGEGFKANESVAITGGGIEKTVKADADGAFSTTVTVPATATNGLLTLAADGASSKAHAETVVVVQGGSDHTATPEPTDSETATPEPTDSETATPEPTDSETATPEPTDSTTPDPSHSATPTTDPTATPSGSATPTPEDTETVDPGKIGDPTALFLNPSPIKAGSTLKITGNQWAPGETVTITVDGTKLTVTAEAAANGTLKTNLVIPSDTRPANYTVTAKGDMGGKVIVNLKVEADIPVYSPKVVLQTGEGKPLSAIRAGGKITVVGLGFPADESVVIELHSDPVVLGGATTDADGNFTKTVDVPRNVPAGTHKVVVKTSGVSEYPSVELVVSAPGSGSKATSTPTSTSGTGSTGTDTDPTTGTDDGTDTSGTEGDWTDDGLGVDNGGVDATDDTTGAQPTTATVDSTSLPMTGATVAPFAIGAVVLLAGGVFMVLRRKAARS